MEIIIDIFLADNDERYIIPYFKEEDNLGISNRWSVVNDNMIQMMGSYNVIVSKQTDDTIILKRPETGEISVLLVRIKGDPKVNKQSLVKRDSLYIEFLKLKEENKNKVTDTVQMR